MKLFSLFSRPAWESADADKRAQAVTTSQDSALTERLPDIARHDADAKVRLAAVRRIVDLSLLGDRARLDLSPEVRDAAGARLRQQLLDAGVALDARVRIVRVLDNSPLLELIASEARERELRACALERIQRVAFLADRCVKDTDASLRLQLLERIDEPAQIERIHERARKNDKQLARMARERLQRLRLAAGDAEAIEARAQELCAAVDQLLRARGEDAERRLAEIEENWLHLAIAAEQPISRRFGGLVDTLRHMLNPPPKPEPPAVSEPVPVAAEMVPVVEVVAEAVLPDAGAEAAKAQAAAAQEAAQSLRRQQRERVHAAVQRYAEALDGGRFVDARSARLALQQLEGEWPRAHWDEGKRLAALDHDYAKLERWQQWSSREQKQRLCEAAEALIGSGLHPDALLTRVRELQGEWERLTITDAASESGDSIARRFRAILNQSIAPAKPYLEKRKELRDEKGRGLSELLDSAEAALADPALPLPALLDWRKQLNDAGAAVAELVGSARRDSGQRRKQLADAVHSRIEAFNSEAREAKQKLIAQVRRQLAAADARDQVNIAKAVMPQWKALPRGQRKSEDALWEELRALIDPVFERERDDSQRVRDERGAQQQAVASTLAEIEALADAELSLDALRQQSSQLRQRFQSLEGRQRDDDLACDRAQARIERRMAVLRAEQLREARTHTAELAARLAAIEQRIAHASADGSEASVLDALREQGIPAELASRHQSLVTALSDAAQAAALADELADDIAITVLAIRCELLAGVASPEADREQRRQLQMARLADKLSGGAAQAAVDEAERLWREWLALPGSGSNARSAFDERIRVALGRLLA
ncbi:MAG: hypothetical protein IPG63_16415 [Xanthomonadales bacterium]|nr:hypothetical protein [Xanthomonadales bacterium]MCC6559874.1 hypothetical protein [Xanthomonadales bacterium]